MKKAFPFLIVCVLVFGACKNSSNEIMQTGDNYPVYGGNKAGNRYSPLDQINVDNVKNLQVAWSYFANEKPDTTKPQKKMT